MKKVSRFVGTTLAVLMAGALCTPVFAEGEESTVPTGTPGTPINKVFHAEHEGTSTSDKLHFTAKCTGTTADSVTAETAPVIRVSDLDASTKHEANEEDEKQNINVTLPKYDHPGVYTYEINETVGNVAGVTYDAKTIHYTVLVTSDEHGNLTATGAAEKNESGKKEDTFTNTYSASSLYVKKKVEGNTGDRNKEFAFTITLTAEKNKKINGTSTVTVANNDSIDVVWNEEGTATVTGSIKNGEGITITNLPKGTEYTVKEDDYTSSQYSTSYDGKEHGTIADENVTTVVTNTKDSTVDTGIITNNMPYILVCAGVLAAGVYAFVKRRNSFNH